MSEVKCKYKDKCLMFGVNCATCLHNTGKRNYYVNANYASFLHCRSRPFRKPVMGLKDNVRR